MSRPSFFAELQRRHVYKVGAMYAVAGWLLVQIVTQVFPIFEVSALAQRIIVLAIVAGFPVALVLSWIFDLTPQGVIRTAEIPASGASPAAVRDRRYTDRRLNLLLGVLLLIAIAFAIAGYTGFVPGHRIADKTAEPAQSWTQSIAVLPFVNFSSDQDNAYFASGIQDEILTRLTGIQTIKVISRTSAEKYKSHPDNLKTVAIELGVATVLEGSVQRAAGRVRVIVQLIDAHTDAHLWASTYDRDVNDIFAVETEISQAVVDALQAKLTPSEAKALVPAAPTQDAEAYDLFLKGEYALHEAETADLVETPLDHADAYYRAALARDPAFALAQARLAWSRLWRQWFFKPLPEDELMQLKVVIDQVIAAAPELPQAWMTLGLYQYWGRRNYADAIDAFRHALTLQPGNARVHFWLSAIERRRSHWDQALSEGALAEQLDPRDQLIRADFGVTFIQLRRWAEAEHEMSRALAIDPQEREAADYLALIRINGDGDPAGAQHAYDGFASGIQLQGIAFGVEDLIDYRIYLDLFKRRFASALVAYAPVAADTPEQALRRLAARVSIRVIAGQRKEAQNECETLRAALEPRIGDHSVGAWPRPALSAAYVCLGRDTDAIRLAQELSAELPMAKDSGFGARYRLGLADMLALTGHVDDALPVLRELLDYRAGGDLMSIENLKLNPVWDGLRGDARFRALIADGAAEAPTKASR